MAAAFFFLFSLAVRTALRAAAADFLALAVLEAPDTDTDTDTAAGLRETAGGSADDDCESAAVTAVSERGSGTGSALDWFGWFSSFVIQAHRDLSVYSLPMSLRSGVVQCWLLLSVNQHKATGFIMARPASPVSFFEIDIHIFTLAEFI
jgi:hypothetical protein